MNAAWLHLLYWTFGNSIYQVFDALLMQNGYYCLSLTHFDVVCSVLVHSGGVHGGHYYAFIRPTLSDQWYGLYSQILHILSFICVCISVLAIASKHLWCASMFWTKGFCVGFSLYTNFNFCLINILILTFPYIKKKNTNFNFCLIIGV